MVERFHADPRVQATELLLQERVPRHAPIDAAAAGRGDARVAAPRLLGGRAPLPLAAHARSRTRSSCRTAPTPPSSPTPAAAPASAAAASVTRHRRRRDARPGQPVPLPARRAQRRGLVGDLPARRAREPEDYLVTFLPERAIFRRRDDGIETRLEIAVSPEDDVEVRRLALTNRSDRPREIEVTSYAEIVLAHAGRRPGPSGLRQAVHRDRVPARERGAALPPAAARRGRARELWAVHVLSLEGRPQGAGGVGDRPRALPRPRPRARTIPQALDGRSLSGTTGAVLDPIVSLRQRIRLPPGGFARLSLRHRDGVARARRRVRPGPEVPRPQRGARARSRSPSPTRRAALRHLGISQRRGAALRAPGLARALRRRLAARGARRPAPAQRARPDGPLAARHLRRPARSCWCAWSRRTTCRSCARCCRRRSTGASRA